MSLFLTQRYLNDTGAEHGAFEFRLTNTHTKPVSVSKFCYSSMTRIRKDVSITGGRLHRRFANHVEISTDFGNIAPGETQTLLIVGLTHPPRNRS